MKPAASILLLFAAASFARPLAAQCAGPILIPTDAAAGDRFGVAVALDGSAALVGAHRDDDLGSDSGSAYVFRFDGASWSQEQKLFTLEGLAFDHFGQSVAIDGNVAVIGAPDRDDAGSNSGAVYVWRFNGFVWIFEQKLTAFDAAAGDRFGWAVAVSGTAIAVSAKTDDDTTGDSGSVYVYRFSAGSWSFEQKLVASDPANIAQLGHSLAMRGDRIVAGAWQDDDAGFFTGAAYVFIRSGGVWAQEQKLVASDAAAFRWLGVSVAIDGNRVVAGAYGDGTNGSEAGAAYVFMHNGTNWAQEQKLLAPDGTANDRFGWSVAVRGARIAVGAHADADPVGTAGSVYPFYLVTGGWQAGAKLSAPGTTAGEQLGYSLSMSGERILAGAWEHSGVGAGSGRAAFFATGCVVGTIGCPGDGTLITPCPCGNFGAAGRGCANSVNAAGARLEAFGTTVPDTTVLTSSGELPSSLSIFLQGDTFTGAGIVFGDGLRCASGVLKRLAVKSAVAGTVVFPQTGDPSITERSAALGDPIASGTSRHYQTYYRDPSATFCPAPAGSTFNATNAVSILW